MKTLDTAFSKKSEKLRKNDLVQMLHFLPKSKQTCVKFDIKIWLEEHTIAITVRTGPLHYKFSRDEARKLMLMKTPTGIPKIWQTFERLNLTAVK